MSEYDISCTSDSLSTCNAMQYHTNLTESVRVISLLNSRKSFTAIRKYGKFYDKKSNLQPFNY